eukprot:TRINITY_DN5655_c0_g1_i2.p1 TRINITY_DN5655_c0_g1~~TRINITY_DN5655_c0_g1_i2.p1  ORF type:complete len:1184 (-),score=202.56 TRINITY_DN5655_c0_g1_i2:24-3482(-)
MLGFGKLLSTRTGSLTPRGTRQEKSDEPKKPTFKELVERVSFAYAELEHEHQAVKKEYSRLCRRLGFEEKYMEDLTSKEPVFPEWRMPGRPGVTSPSKEDVPGQISEVAPSSDNEDSCSGRSVVLSHNNDRNSVTAGHFDGHAGRLDTSSSGSEKTEDEDESPMRIDFRDPMVARDTAQAQDSGNEDNDLVFPEWRMPGRPGANSPSKEVDAMGRLWESFDGVGSSATISKADPCVLSPVGWPRLSWDMLGFVCIVVQLWISSISFAFLLELTTNLPGGEILLFSHFESFITIFFCLDIALNFNTGVMCVLNGVETIAMDRRSIFTHYVCGWFFIDIIATVPFDRLVESVNVDLNIISLVRIFRVSRLLRLLRTLRIIRAMRMVKNIRKGFELEMERIKRKFMLPGGMFLTLLFLSHVNGCLLWYVQGAQHDDVLLHERSVGDDAAITRLLLNCYFQSFSRCFLCFTLAYPLEGMDTPLGYVLQMSMAIERSVVIAVITIWLMCETMRNLEQRVKVESLKEQALVYLEERSVSHKTRVQVLHQLNEASTASYTKRRFDNWISQDIPHELHRTIAEELWSVHLSKLGIIEFAMSCDKALSVELAMIVREETFASRNVLFKEGDVPLAAYMVLHGAIYVVSSLTDKPTPDFTAGMWVGEKALVNPALGRSITAICRTTSTLLVIPADGFRKLLIDFNLQGTFEEYCVRKLWHGICGRCGVVGDHFANDCPEILDQHEKVRKKKENAGRFSSFLRSCCCPFSNGQSDSADPAAEAYACYSKGSDTKGHGSYEYMPLSDGQAPAHTINRGLREFLRVHKIKAIAPLLEQRNARSLEDIEAMEEEDLTGIVAQAMSGDVEADDQLGVVNEFLLRQVMDPLCVAQFRDDLEQRAKGALATRDKRAMHLVFLSHHKWDAGTEASLLRHEIEEAVGMHPQLKHIVLDTPVFLDSEDLSNLETLQEHVKNSHNILLLLTTGVLTRPWVLVEIATATRNGVPVLPLEIRKPSNDFRFPDEKFYLDLVDGNLLPKSSMQVLNACKITLWEVETSIKKVFNRISFPYSPHRPAAFRTAEVQAVLKEIQYSPDFRGACVQHRKFQRLQSESVSHVRPKLNVNSNNDTSLGRQAAPKFPGKSRPSLRRSATQLPQAELRFFRDVPT